MKMLKLIINALYGFWKQEYFYHIYMIYRKIFKICYNKI